MVVVVATAVGHRWLVIVLLDDDDDMVWNAQLVVKSEIAAHASRMQAQDPAVLLAPPSRQWPPLETAAASNANQQRALDDDDVDDADCRALQSARRECLDEVPQRRAGEGRSWLLLQGCPTRPCPLQPSVAADKR